MPLKLYQEDESFTFQSGYIQMLAQVPQETIKHHLYIPIWLYSNNFTPEQHKIRNELYIPIWLYSNAISSFPNGSWAFFTFQSGYIQIKDRIGQPTIKLDLYIPIWLYSNIAAACAVCKFVIFTFQSGYIQIVSDLYRTRVFFTFTFQSGYIQM